MTPEQYYRTYEVAKIPLKTKENMFLVNFCSYKNYPCYPSKAVLKIIKIESQEDEMHELAMKLCKNSCVKMYYNKDLSKTKELFLEHYPRGTLAENLKLKNELPAEFIKKSMHDLSVALKKFHSKHFFHGNIAIHNLYVSHTLSYSGFSLSGEENKPSSDNYNFIHNYYNPNEYQMMIRNPFLADIWNLGFVFFQMVVGEQDDGFRYIFKGDQQREAKRLLKTKNISKQVRKIILAMISIPPNISMNQVVNQLPIPYDYKTEIINKEGCSYCGFVNYNSRNEIDSWIPINPLCPHLFHVGCLRDHLRMKIYYAKSINDIKCKYCEAVFPYSLETYTSKFDYKVRLKAELLYYNSQTFICPEGHVCEPKKMLNEKLKRYKISCDKCKSKYCSFCGQVHLLLKGCRQFEVLEKRLKRISDEYWRDMPREHYNLCTK
ncbi:hypothetical protein SteCoe_37340 [Stentor coeruleus]|uniref:Protein kinase domain-containing protein n=1 Tax=Stentor coeruleus TaxID=5963 RepID=A0A1R2AN72_9CILI|nr:hypothetical protein SteCoe_37340 [Stentor coeruleus]